MPAPNAERPRDRPLDGLLDGSLDGSLDPDRPSEILPGPDTGRKPRVPHPLKRLSVTTIPISVFILYVLTCSPMASYY